MTRRAYSHANRNRSYTFCLYARAKTTRPASLSACPLWLPTIQWPSTWCVNSCSFSHDASKAPEQALGFSRRKGQGVALTGPRHR